MILLTYLQISCATYYNILSIDKYLQNNGIHKLQSVEISTILEQEDDRKVDTHTCAYTKLQNELQKKFQ